MMGSQNEPVFIDDKSGVDFSAYIPDPKDLMNSQANGTKPVNGLENTLASSVTNLHNTIIELAKENGFSESTAVKKFMDDVTKNYRLVQGFESRVEELKSEAEDTEAGLIMLRQSEAELDNVTSSLRKLWAIGIRSDDIVNLAKSLDRDHK